MGVRESLVLDHFYLGLAEADFDRLIQLKDLLGATSHAKVVTKGDAWEGVYVGCRTRTYFEVLRDRRHGGFGICLSPYNLLSVDANRIREDLPEFPWRHGTRVADDGQPWYDWLATCDYLDHRNTVFNAWIMKYHQSHRDWTRPIPRPSVDRFERVHLRVGRDHRAAIELTSAWFPGQRLISEEGARFDFPDREGSPFSVRIDFVPGNDRFELVGLELRLADPAAGERLQTADLGAFTFDVAGERAVFRKK